MTKNAMFRGCTSRPTPRSETAMLRSNILRVFGKDEVFLMAWIVIPFRMIAMQHKKPFKTQRAM